MNTPNADIKEPLVDVCVRVALTGTPYTTLIPYKGKHIRKKVYTIRKAYREACVKLGMHPPPLNIKLRRDAHSEGREDYITLTVSKKYPDIGKILQGSVQQEIEEVLAQCHAEGLDRADTASRILYYIKENFIT